MIGSAWVKNKLRKWLGIDNSELELALIRRELAVLESRIDQRMKELDRLTKMDADISFRGDCMVVLSGVYRGKGYVQFYEVPAEEFRHIVERYRGMRRSNIIRHMDAPIGHRGGGFLL
ncbi:hypothetical protein [Phaeobacter phage MD18]|nr:hypothetical protein [Phaeobacter phage MD18]